MKAEIIAKARFFEGSERYNLSPGWWADVVNKDGYRIGIQEEAGVEIDRGTAIDLGYRFENGYGESSCSTFLMALALADMTGKDKSHRDYAKNKVQRWYDTGSEIWRAAQAAIAAAKAISAAADNATSPINEGV
jgi:hypothetical protein